MGARVLGSISDIINKINSVGGEVFYAQNAFTTLFGSEERASEEIQKIKEYAAESIFNFKDLIPVVRMLKANGIDAFQQIATKTFEATQGAEGYKQTLMDYASDLAAFNPQMHNAYGEGIQAAMGAINEYVAEGNKRLLKSGASLDITQLLGEGVGATIEERAQQVANLLEQLNMVGQTAMMRGTPMQMISNMEDQLFIFLDKVAQAGGVYEKYTGMISKVAELVLNITDSDMDAFAKSLGDGLVAVLNPVDKLLTRVIKLTKSLMDIVKLHPRLLKYVTLGATIAGTFLVVTGVLFKTIGAFAVLANAISTFASGPIMGALVGGFSSLAATLAPLALLFASLAVAWNTDFAGIRTDVTGFVSNIIDSFNNARDIVSLDADSMMQRINILRNSGDFWSNITIGFSKLLVVAQALSELLSSEDGFTLNADTFQKLEELGLLPLIESFLDAKARFLEFKDGFIEGFNEMSDTIGGFFDSLTGKADGTIFESLLNSLNDFLTKLNGADLGAWNDFGNSVGKIAGALLMLAPAIAVARAVLTPFIAVGRLLMNVFGGVGKVIRSVFQALGQSTVLTNIAQSLGKTFSGAFNNIGVLISTNLQSALSGALNGVLSFLGGLSAPIIAVIAVVLASVFTYAITKWDEFKAQIDSVIQNFVEGLNEIFGGLVGAFQQVWDTLTTTGAGVIESAVGLFEKLKETLSTLFDVITSSGAFQYIVDMLSAVGELIVSTLVPHINSLWNIIVTVVTEVANIIGTTVSSIISIVGSFISMIMDTVSGLLDIIMGLITGNGEQILQGINTIFSGALNFITTVFTEIADVMGSLIQGGVNIVMSVITGLVNNIRGTISAILGFVSSTFSAIVGLVTSNIENVSSSVTNTLNSMSDFVKGAIDKIKSFFEGEFPIPKIKLPHFKISGKLSLDPPQIPSISVDWYAQGGVFNRPRIIGVGENGAEAVMPLENNLGWIDTLANEIGNRMRVVPTANNYYSEQPLVSGSTYNNYSSTTTAPANNVDNSVVFNSGSIVVNVANASMEEAERFAQIVMEKIQRKTQVDRVMNYKSLNASDNEFIF